MSVKFLIAVQIVIKLEGGDKLHKNPLDPGGLTRYGISARSYPDVDIENLTRQEALEIYYRDYWLPIKGDKLPHDLALCVFDCAINQGQGTATRMLQDIVDTKIDGIIGPITLKAVKNYGDSSWLTTQYMASREARYVRTTGYAHFGRGWIARLFQVCGDARVMKELLDRTH